MGNMRCKISGCDLDDCGQCKRCGAQTQASHDWNEVERERPCFKRELCSRCQTVREQPDHDWDIGPTGMRCNRCKMSI